jgi:hypothetical protein
MSVRSFVHLNGATIDTKIASRGAVTAKSRVALTLGCLAREPDHEKTAHFYAVLPCPFNALPGFVGF